MTDPRFLKVLESLGPEAPKLWEQADEAGRVSMALTAAATIRRVLGDAKANIAFQIMFQQATR